MDTVTHALLGTAIAEVGFRNKIGRKALFAGAIYASLPDADMFFALSGDPAAIFTYHRAASHSLILACIASPLLGWIGWRLSKRDGMLLSWILLSLAALFSHDLLDLCTTWGTQVLYPLTNERFSLDALPIIDPLILLPLLSVLLGIIIMKNMKLRRYFAILVLVWCTLYTATGYMLSNQALQLAMSDKPEEFAVDQGQAIPSIGTILLWHVVLKDYEGNYFTSSVASIHDRVFNKRYFESVSNDHTENILQSDDFEVFLRASRGMLLADKAQASNSGVKFIDMRYSMLDKLGESIPIFFFDVSTDDTGLIIEKVERPIPDRSKAGGLEVYLNAIFN